MATSSPVAVLVLPLSNNPMVSATGIHRAKVTFENESGLYLSPYNLARGQRDNWGRFEVRRIRSSTRLGRDEAGRDNGRRQGEVLGRALRYPGVIKRQVLTATRTSAGLRKTLLGRVRHLRSPCGGHVERSALS